MCTLGFTYWQEEPHWIGYLEEFPDYMTQGASLLLPDGETVHNAFFDRSFTP